MDKLPRSIRGFFLVMALSAFALFLALEKEQAATAARLRFRIFPVLGEAPAAFQGKSPIWAWRELPQSLRLESLTVGRLIAAQVDPAFWSEERIRELSIHIVLRSREHQVSPLLVLSLIHVESSFRHNAVSPRGAVGLMQLMPATAREAALGLGMPFEGVATLEDPLRNVDLGLYYMSRLKNRFPSLEHSLTAYNIGPAALERKLKNGEEIPLGYYHKVMHTMRGYESTARPARGKRKTTLWL